MGVGDGRWSYPPSAAGGGPPAGPSPADSSSSSAVRSARKKMREYLKDGNTPSCKGKGGHEGVRE